MKDKDFISILQSQAKEQSRLHEDRLLPKNVDWITSIIGNNTWQFLLVLAVLGALIWQYLG